MYTLVRAGFIAIGIFCSMAARAQDAIPPALREWQGWVLHDQEFRRCPFASSADAEAGEPIDAAEFRCVWPEQLTLTVEARGGTFSQRWQVYAESWVALPGDAEHWPRDVRLNGAPVAVVARDEVPQVRLKPGTYALSGRFEWSSRPESLKLPQSTAIVDLFVDGTRVAQPERPDGGVWLGKRRSAEQAAAMEVQVYRLVRDEIPTYLHTRIRLNVAGDAREELLGRVLPEGFTPLSLADVQERLKSDEALLLLDQSSSSLVSGGAPTQSATPLRSALQWNPENGTCSQTSVSVGQDCPSALTPTSPSTQLPQDCGLLCSAVVHHQAHER